MGSSPAPSPRLAATASPLAKQRLTASPPPNLRIQHGGSALPKQRLHPASSSPRQASPAGSQISACSTTASFDTIMSSRSSSPQVTSQRSFLNAQVDVPAPLERFNRPYRRVLIIETGFGRRMNPGQSQIIVDAGFQVGWLEQLPNPEISGIPVVHFLGHIKNAIDQFQPDLLMCASKGGPYMIAAWEAGLWGGPSLMINRHPSLQRLPTHIRIVICQGSNDEVYPVCNRAELESLVSSGAPNQTMLYYTCNGVNACGNVCRRGDTHNQMSLLEYDCLPRLMDAALAQRESPEMQLMRSWIDVAITPQRLQAESFLGYTPESLFRFWTISGRAEEDTRVLFPVSPAAQEFSMVSTLFHANPKVPSAYPGYRAHATILGIERVENATYGRGNFQAHCASLRTALEKTGVSFEPALHMRWAFHGSDAHSIASIARDPVGTYFARDANYCFHHFCKPQQDGTKKLLVCLLASGMPCLGNSETPISAFRARQGQYTYNSALDSMSNPEIYIMPESSAYPAYVITFSD